MTFTDTNPLFPYQSSEAALQLGVPNSPAIHLAISHLAERLLPLASDSLEPEKNIRITALRTASYGVLMTLPWECVAFRFCVSLGLQGNQRAADEAYSTHRTDWLGKAITQLNDEGITTPTNVRQQATPYGWRESQA